MRKRIEQIRKEAGLSQEKFAKRLGMSRSFFNQVETGKNNVSDRTIADICREFNVREEWLRTGEGEMYIHKPREEEIAGFIRNALSNEPESFKARLISALARLNASDWAALEKMFDAVYNTPEQPVMPPQTRKTREQEADEVADRIREEIRNGGEKASESGTPPAGAGIA